VWIGILAFFTLSEFLFLGLARRTFVFYNRDNGVIVVEDRMLKTSKSKEGDIVRYMEEVLLGPVSPELLPLFSIETRLKSLLFNNGVVYADFSEDAVFPPSENGNTLHNFKTLYAGILRNFSYVKNVRFFIEGNAVYVEEFRGI
jgi:spore germination protein GerM